MSNEEFIKWKSENRDEYDLVLLSIMELVFKDLLKHSLDDPFLMSIHPDPEHRVLSYRDVVMALSGDADKADIKDGLVRDMKKLADYLGNRKNKSNENLILAAQKTRVRND